MGASCDGRGVLFGLFFVYLVPIAVVLGLESHPPHDIRLYAFERPGSNARRRQGSVGPMFHAVSVAEKSSWAEKFNLLALDIRDMVGLIPRRYSHAVSGTPAARSTKDLQQALK